MPPEHEIAHAVREFIAESFLFRAGADSIGDDDSLLEGRIIDSMGVLELITFLEAKFDIRIGDDETVPENLDSIARISGFVRRKLDAMMQAPEAAHAS